MALWWSGRLRILHPEKAQPRGYPQQTDADPAVVGAHVLLCHQAARPLKQDQAPSIEPVS